MKVSSWTSTLLNSLLIELLQSLCRTQKGGAVHRTILGTIKLLTFIEETIKTIAESDDMFPLC